MNNEIREMLEEEIENEIDGLSQLEPGSEEHSKAVVSLEKLYKLKLEEDKLEAEMNEKEAKLEFEKEQHDEEMALKESQFNAELELKERQIDNDVTYHDSEEQYRLKQLREQRFDLYFRIGMFALGLIADYTFREIWMRRGFRFEETGNITSNTHRNHYNDSIKLRRK